MAARKPSDWPAASERCAGSVPDAFRFNLHSVLIFLNGSKTLLGGAQPPCEAELRYSEGGRVLVNRDLDTLPGRLQDDDVGLTQDQWTGFMQALKATSERLPADPLFGGLTLGVVNDSDWRAAVTEVLAKHLEVTFVKGVAAVTLETAFWTEVDPERLTESGDLLAVPRSMPVVRIQLQAGLSHAPALHPSSEAASARRPRGGGASGAGGAGGAGADGGDYVGSGGGAAGRRRGVGHHNQLLPWAHQIDLVPKQRLFGARASYH